MKHVKKSVLLWYSPREMYDLVVGVDRYPEFLPWCERAEVLSVQQQESTVETVTARLHLAYAGVRHAFTTRNDNSHNRRVDMNLVDGPFSMLEGVWQFLPLNKPGVALAEGQEAQACKVEFELRYAFSSLALEAVVSPVFDRVANTFVERFVQRAESVYGAR
ncbi:type II toxin-antitoxin system RatA family toxin [Roseateles koreensis]|uniref:Type II toxin-antitoxin system RatA family toxin n=1 Tax=Roseateles koreensis TaxID=2987526 RepID=A0ABT5KMX3_9BURK|nr:type II toxin-antitoxin system RatA family toxin [Roseateles koreensis]MDC8783805.1 type II toxin-antitoxin system RatA family toxin [Roseateles koreensis]